MKEHRGGYHGTKLYTAQGVETEGFESRDKVLCFTPMDDEGFERAKEYGKIAATNCGDASYGVIEAVFKTQAEEYDAHGRPQIEIMPADISSICVMQVMYFDAM